MTKVTLFARVLLGLVFFVFGLNGFLQFMPVPETMPENLTAFMKGMSATGYFFPLLSGTQIFCGILLLINKFVPLALVVLAPVILNIFLVHFFMEPSGLVIAIILGLLEVYLAFFSHPYSKVIKKLFA